MSKVALIVHGQPRTYEFCFSSLKKHIIDIYQPDIFICTDARQEHIRELYKPVAIDVQTQDHIFDFAYAMRAGFPSVMAVNDISVSWKLHRAMQLKEWYEKENNFIYDVVISTRFDVKFQYVPRIEAQENTLHLPLTGGYWLTPPDVPGIHWGGYSSHLCWSTSTIMDKLANIYFDKADYLTLAVNSGVSFGWAPEYVLKYFCDVNQINIKFEEINIMLIRGTSNNPLSFHNRKLSEYPEYL